MKNTLAVIQAGGLGTRMRQLTEDKVPKPMLLLGGRPLLEWQIEAVKSYGITDVVIIIGHLGEQIRAYFRDGSRWNVRIDYVEEKDPLGSAGALYYIKDKTFDTYFLIFGDVMFDINLDRLFDFHHKMRAGITLVSHPNTHPYDSDLLVTDSNDCVIRILGKKEERKSYSSNLVNSGLSVFERSILNEITEPVKTDWEQDIVKKYIQTGLVYSYRTSEYIKDTGTPERYKRAAKEQSEGLWEKRNLKRKQRCIFLDRDGTLNKYLGLISRPEQLELYEDAAEAIKRINESGYLAIIVTNQPVVARGMCSEEDIRMIHCKLETMIGDKGAYLDDIVFCPHHPDRGYPEENPIYKIKCDCRKPNVGMIRKMQDKYNIDLSQSYIIGDTTGDIMTGINAGLHTILLMTGEAGSDKKYDVKPDYVAEDLQTAVDYILGKEK